MQAAASRFLGRLWAGSNSHNSVKSISLNPNSASASNLASIRRSASKQSMTSTLNSVESASDASTAPTELSTDTHKPRVKSAISQHKDRDLHTQIEELLMALSDLQRQHADLTRELQQEREEREEDQTLAKSMLQYIKETSDDPPMDLVHKADARFAMIETPKNVTNNQTKHQLRDDLNRYKEMHALESSRCKGLTRRIDEHEKENSSLREQLREARGRIQDSYRERQRLERMVRELRTVKTKTRNSDTAPSETFSSPTSDTSEGYTSTGLRELKLVRTNSQKSTKSTATPTTFNKRSSSLGLQSVLATENNKPAAEEALLLELVNAKTAEAVARQELEEVKGKMDSMRKIMTRHGIIPEGRHSFLGRPPSIAKAVTEPAPNGGGLFSGWGRRAVSTSNESYDGR